MSPILVRPVREQLEHDRVIRLLQAKYKRKFEVAINPGHEQTTPVGTGTDAWYPDLVLQSPDKNRKLLGVVEVETAESVNHLEAMSQWAALARLRAPFHLYVPAACIDSSRRLASELSIPVAELWAYQAIGDQMRFTVVQKTTPAEPKGGRADGETLRPAGPGEPAEKPAPRKEAARKDGGRPEAVKPAEPARVATKESGKKEPPKKAAGGKTAAAKAPASKTAGTKSGSAKTSGAKAAAKAVTKRPAASNGKSKSAPKAKAAAPRRAAAKTPARKAAGSAPKRK